jgi:hypothetical protein
MSCQTVRVRTATVVVALGLALTGCGSTPVPGASHVAGMFYRAVARHQGGLACRQLAPQTRQEVAQTEKAPCSAAILQEDLPAQGRVVDVQRFGHQVQVRGRGDTAFLAEFPNGWKVVAVSCTPRRSRPYDCQVKS